MSEQQAGDPERRRRPGGAARGRARPAAPLRRATTACCAPIPARTALDALAQLQLRGEPVALSGGRPAHAAMTGVEFLERGARSFPRRQAVLLTAYADTDAAINAINAVKLDYYLMKPWDPPEEQLYPVLDDLLADWLAGSGRRSERHPGRRATAGPRESHELRDFLARNQSAYRWLDVERDAEAGALLERPAAARTACRWWCSPTATVLERADRRGGRREGGPATPRRAALLRPGDRRRRPGRAGRGGLRRVRGAAHGAGRARGAGRPGRAELAHRELPRLPRRAQRAPTSPAARPPRRSASAPRSCRCRTSIAPRGPRARRGSCASPTATSSRPRRARGHRRRIPPAGRARRRAAHRAAASTTARAQPRRWPAGRARLRGRRRQLGRARPRSTSPATPSRSRSSAAATPRRRACPST